ncbi:MAG: DUF692 domain-containing protein [Betaproteobacteria bacterium]|nr:MAG: DUF692 domain-containing protein [Betaproteobacteria bacterium]
MKHDSALRGAGLGLRRELIPALTRGKPDVISFYEVAPENWMDMGGAKGKAFRALTERTPLVCHGLSLSLGGPTPLDEVFLRKLRSFLELHRVPLYTEHLSYCSDDGHLYDLMPIPFTAEAVRYVAQRIRQTQDILGRRIAIENASFYTKSPVDEMSELAFVRAVVEEADCWLHLDVNNVYVNSVNHRYDPREFLRGVPADRVVYMHMAGHYHESDDLLVDTHGAAVIDPVWDLLDFTYREIGVHPTLLERDFNIPPLEELVPEVARIASLQQRYLPGSAKTHVSTAANS